jgi:hypothetical protein
MRSKSIAAALLFVLVCGCGSTRGPVTSTIADEDSVGTANAARAPVGRAEVHDLRLRESGVVIVWGHFTRGTTDLDIIAAPGRAPDWVSMLLRGRGAPLVRCDQLRLAEGTWSVAAPVVEFDRSGREVRFEVPVSAIVRAALATDLTLEACNVRWTFEPGQLAELRRLALYTLLRRAQAAPGAAPVVVYPPGSGEHAPWRTAAGEIQPIRGSVVLSPIERAVFGYDAREPNRVTLELNSTRPNARYPECEVSVEVGPVALNARRLSVNENLLGAMHEIHRVDDFITLGLVDQGWIRYCGRRANISTMLGGLRRLILATALARADTQGSLDIELPAPQDTERTPAALPSDRTGAPEPASSSPPLHPL